MNSIISAMKQAGIKTKPLPERVWRYIADHPKVCALTVSRVLKEPATQVSAACSKMTARGMLHCEPVLMRSKVGRGSGLRKIKHYTVAHATYELLPMPLTNMSTFSHLPLAPRVDAVVDVKTPSVLDVNLMPLGEARALYEQLKRVFG